MNQYNDISASEAPRPLRGGSGSDWGVLRRQLLAMAAATALWLSPGAACAQPGTPAAAPETERATQAPSSGSDLRIYIDPVTGKRAVLPPGAKTSKPANKLIAPAPKRKEYNLGLGKGHAIDMRGRLHEMRAAGDEHGRIHWHCN